MVVGVGTITGAGSPTITGELRIDAGTLHYGSGNNNLDVTALGRLIMSGGTINMLGRVSFATSVTCNLLCLVET